MVKLVGKQKTKGFDALHLTHDLSEILLLEFCSLLALGAVVGGAISSFFMEWELSISWGFKPKRIVLCVA
jgi:hypothetical protein